MGRKALEKVLWIVIVSVVAIVVAYVIIKVTGTGFHGFEETLKEGIGKTNETIQRGVENITKGEW